jgi:hypothetical protein
MKRSHVKIVAIVTVSILMLSSVAAAVISIFTGR